MGVARAFGGALIFSFPLLMTMEVWWLGYSMHPVRLVLMLLLSLPLLTWLAHYAGFEESVGWKDNVLGAFVAYATAYLASALMLLVFGILSADLSLDAIVGVITLAAIPNSIGASVARSQLGVAREPGHDAFDYVYHLLSMAAGAVFLSLSVACTEEMLLIAEKMTEWHVLGLMVVSLVVIHAFVRHFFRVHSAGAPHRGRSGWEVFLRFTVVGYAIALLIGAYILWTFGRSDGLSLTAFLESVVVVAFPASLGAGAARVIL